ncbi:MAG TPA: MarR family transcriptional regulator [Candidatus Limnocylindria bacterium]
MSRSDYVLLARVRIAIRALNRAIEAGSAAAGLTVQQQGFLLALSARGGRDVALADVRAELGMDQATASDLLARLGRRGLVKRTAGADRRSVRLALTREGRSSFERSVREVRAALRAADRAGELAALTSSMNEYLRYYGIGKRRR